MKSTAEERRWKVIFDDPATPPELRAEAARRLKIEVPAPSQGFAYTAALDEVVQFYWHRRKEEKLFGKESRVRLRKEMCYYPPVSTARGTDERWVARICYRDGVVTGFGDTAFIAEQRATRLAQPVNRANNLSE